MTLQKKLLASQEFMRGGELVCARPSNNQLPGGGVGGWGVVWWEEGCKVGEGGGGGGGAINFEFILNSLPIFYILSLKIIHLFCKCKHKSLQVLHLKSLFMFFYPLNLSSWVTSASIFNDKSTTHAVFEA